MHKNMTYFMDFLNYFKKSLHDLQYVIIESIYII